MDENIKRPFAAYEGDEKYIFVSYAHKDRNLVFPEIKRFHDEGYPIWYDDGLTPGQEWDDEIAIALLGCSLLVVFISKNSMASTNVQDEIKLALEEKIDITPIYLEEAKLPPGLRLRLSNKHAIFKHSLSDKDYERDCLKAFRNANIPKIKVEVPSKKTSLKDNAAPSPADKDKISKTANLETGTIDYAIDLGTTRSSIAKVDGKETFVIPNINNNRDFVSSAVFISDNGSAFVGDKAKQMIAKSPTNAFGEFKLRMGSNHIYEFENSGMEMTPVGLSAEILKNLKSSAKHRCQKDLQSVVVTVPSDFTFPQTHATAEAAKLAGFKEVILLQDSTAAAMAYGFGNSDDEIWLIYDFGGGTFEASVMKKGEDEIVSINNQGDTYLGGKLIDWDIVDKVFVPTITDELALSDFNRGNEKYLKQFAKLKNAAEKAKIKLSNSDAVEVSVKNLLTVADGSKFDFEYELTRKELDGIMKPYVDRTINHCRKALDDVCLGVGDVGKIILVGGSTLSPYVRQRLTEELNIPLEYSIDPTTVVVRGAAIYAGTKISRIIDDKPESGFVSVGLLYDVFGDDIEFNVNGKIFTHDGSPEGYSVEFVNEKTGFSSGMIPVAKNGFFTTDLLVDDEEDYNYYQIKVYDASGNIAKLSPNCQNSVKYKMDIIPLQPKLSHTLGLGKYGNELDVIARKSTELPFHFTKTYNSYHALHKGDESDQIYIPLYQGNMLKADRNTLIGYLKITGEDINADLPEGSEIELYLTIDESMTIESSVYSEYLDQDFDEGMVIVQEKLSHEVLLEKFKEHESRYNRILEDSEATTNVQVQDYFTQIASENMIDNIETFLKNAETDPDALDNASKRINEFANILDNIEMILDRLLSWNELKEEVDKLIEDIESNIDKADSQISELYEQMRSMYNSAVETRNVQLLAFVKDKLLFIFSQTHGDELIILAFRNLASSEDFTDQSLADELIQKGNDAVINGNITELKSIFGQLHKIHKPSEPKDDDKDNQMDNRLK